jgi:DNA-binding CsgD family transcriptional regulator
LAQILCRTTFSPGFWKRKLAASVFAQRIIIGIWVAKATTVAAICPSWISFSAQLGSRNGSGSQPTFAFFNVCPVDDSRVISKELLAHGLRGVFNEGESLEIMGRGIRAMLNGELWIPRKNLEALLLETESETFSTTCQGTNLTSREKEIILIVASGASNQQIADQLFISPHTVRTHLHNLFTKINVTSRLQAALWVASNLQSHSPIMSVKPPPPSNHFVLKN